MSAAIAMVPSPAPHERQHYPAERPSPSSKASASAPSPAASNPSAHKATTAAAPPSSLAPSASRPRTGHSTSPKAVASSSANMPSPPSHSRVDPANRPQIIVKKEPGSPTLSQARPRPRRLDLSKNTSASASKTAASAVPLSARDGLGIQEVGIACLSPGFVTQNPAMKEQLQRSMSVREQQRHIIEARLQQQSAKIDVSAEKDKEPAASFAAKTPGMSRKNKAPPGLSIVTPSHEQFAHERVIQSAPLGHTFTGRQHPAPMSRHVANQPSNLSSTSHIHHVPAIQSNTRLPPISDVFGQTVSAHPDNAARSLYHANPRAPWTSPGHPPHPQQPPTADRPPREYKSAEEAQHDLAGGRPELLPKIVHYGGHQAPAPSSPLPGTRHAEGVHSASRRRTRAEFEEGASPPLGHGPAPTRRGPFGEGRDSPESQRQKKDEFLRLCARAWDLFHS